MAARAARPTDQPTLPEYGSLAWLRNIADEIDADEKALTAKRELRDQGIADMYSMGVEVKDLRAVGRLSKAWVYQRIKLIIRKEDLPKRRGPKTPKEAPQE